MKIAIIGSGFGGLAAALLLAYKGHQVIVFEQQAAAGGKAQQMQLGKYRFDKGPSLLTQPFVFEDLFKRVEKEFTNYVPYEALDVVCNYWYSDGTTLSTYNDREKLFNELTSKLDVSRESLENFYRYSKIIYDNASHAFLYHPLQTKNALDKRNLHLLFNLGKLDAMSTMDKSVRKFFKDEKVIQLFERYATYIGSNPFICPGTLNIISQVEQKYGSFYPKNGIYSMIEGLVKACKEEGVEFEFNTPVQEILMDKKTVKGLKVNNKKLAFDKVVSNVDVTHLYKDLVAKPTRMRKKYTTLEPSSSALVFFWGVKGNYPQLDSHNIFFSENYKEEFNDLFNKKICPNDPTVYISISSKYNPKDAPKNGESWFVMINAPYVDNQDWDKEIARQRKIIKEKLERVLGPIDIAEEATLTPMDIMEKTNSNKGGIYGTSSNSKMAAFLRHQNKSALKNLYCCGGSTHPGGGMTLSTLSGMFVADFIK